MYILNVYLRLLLFMYRRIISDHHICNFCRFLRTYFQMTVSLTFIQGVETFKKR